MNDRVSITVSSQIADVRLTRAGKMNALDPAMFAAIGDAIVTWGWRQLPMLVIAAVHGVAFGGGFQIMPGADIRAGVRNPDSACRSPP